MNLDSRSRKGRAAFAFFAILLVLPQIADAAPAKEPSVSSLQAERDAVRNKKAAAAKGVDALEATDEEVKAALAALNENVSGQASLYEESKRAVAQAEADEAAALKAQDEASAELAQLTKDMKAKAVNAFVNSESDAFLELLSAESLADTTAKKTLQEVNASQDVDAAERSRSVREDLEIAKRQAEKARARANEKRDEVSAKLKDLEAAQDEQEAYAEQVEAALDHKLSEAASLASLDKELSSQITTRQTAIAKQLQAERAAAQARAAAAGAQRRSSSGSSSSGGGSSSSGPSVQLPQASGGLTTVHGITVSSSIAGALNRMINAAAADGISLSGGGYRDPAGQIRVRKNNCGTSQYAIYQMPSSSCSPPTARPGTSQHERGLAIDFTSGGRTLTRSSAAYSWLKAHAASFGFYNLPSEAWHWSTTGN